MLLVGHTRNYVHWRDERSMVRAVSPAALFRKWWPNPGEREQGGSSEQGHTGREDNWNHGETTTLRKGLARNKMKMRAGWIAVPFQHFCYQCLKVSNWVWALEKEKVCSSVSPVGKSSCLWWKPTRKKCSLWPSLLLASVQLLNCVRLFATPWIAAHQASLSITNSWSSLRLTSIKSVMPSSHLILCHSLLLLPPIPPSIRVFSNESTLRMRWPEYWSFSFSISPSKEHPGLISFKISLQSKGLSRVFSNTTVQKHQFFGTQLSSQSNSHIHTWLLDKP